MELLATVVVYITGVFLTIVIAFIIKWFVLWGSKFKDLPRKIPGPTQLPIFGNTFQFLVSPESKPQRHLLIPLNCCNNSLIANAFSKYNMTKFSQIAMNYSADFLPLFDKWTEEYGHRILYRVGTYWIVGLSNPKDIEVS